MESQSDRRTEPGRSLRLLWRLDLPGRRGPKQSLDVDDIVRNAVEMADKEGLDGLSMRRLAERLGVGAMTLYTYVPAKTDLLDLMYDHIVGEGGAEYEDAADLRSKLEAIALAQWKLLRNHPWASQMPWTRTPLGPNILDAYERAVSLLTGLGLQGKEMTELFTLLSSYVHGAARLAVEAVRIAEDSAIDDSEWWSGVGPVLEQIWDQKRFPTLSGPAMAGAWEYSDDQGRYFLAEAVESFEFGLARVLDGIEAYIAEAQQRL